MPLTDTFVRQVKPSKPSGDKHADGGGMYLLVKPTGKYWRMDLLLSRSPQDARPWHLPLRIPRQGPQTKNKTSS